MPARRHNERVQQSPRVAQSAQPVLHALICSRLLGFKAHKLGLLALLAVTALHLAYAREARADASDGLLRATELTQAAKAARGPDVYTALRSLWLAWDAADPAAIEAGLKRLSTERTLTPSARAYAGLLHAYALRRRGDISASRAEVAQLGYLSKFAIVGPFDNEGKGGFERVLAPEVDRFKAWDPAAIYQGKERATHWRTVPDVFTAGWVDFGALLRPQENVCAFAVTFVRQAGATATTTRDVTLFGGANGAVRVYWNGDEVLADEKYRLVDAERFGTRVRLQPGYNRLLLKACGNDNAPLFALRIGDAQGNPDQTLVHSAELPASAADAAERHVASKVPATYPRLGALAAFEAALKQSRPADMQALAEYLTKTQGDDPAEMRARELALAAAKAQPTMARMLLAASLVEDRNQRAEWLAKADALAVKSPRESLDLLLARANHARSGVRWQDSVPYFDAVLACDPDNTTATIARSDLYTEAGLKETAIRLLQTALTRKPQSVALLRTLSGNLREAGRDLEAEELQARYALLRFDDSSYVRSQLDLAVARRRQTDAAHWAARLIELNPESNSALATVARMHVAFGERGKALALYKHALDLNPEDVDSMRLLADCLALGGQRDERVRLMRRILELKPQDKDVREYLAHLEPEKPKADEKYAVASAEFLKDRDAAAGTDNRRTLVDMQVTTVFENGLASRFHQVVFQPLTDIGAAQAREYAFSYEADSSVVQLRGARVYRKNGQVEEAAETGETAADNPDIAMYTSGRVFYVHFPRLFPGDVVELLYRIEDVAEQNAFADYFGEVRYFGGRERIARSEYVLIAPKSRKLFFNPIAPGIVRTDSDEGASHVYAFKARNLPELASEPGQPPSTETLPRVHASTYRNWDEMGVWYWGLVRDQFTADDEVRKRAREVSIGLTTDADRVRAVYNYVVQKTRYVALEFGIHGFKPYRCAQIFARGFGDCKDKATLIVTMLKELGIPATIVILRTGMRGDFESAPASLAPFDHAIAYVPSLDLYLDGTAENTGAAELPAMDRGALALRIHEGKPVLVHLPDPPAAESVLESKLDVQMQADGSANVTLAQSASGLFASARRSRYQAPDTRKPRLVEDVSTLLPRLEVRTLDVNDLANLNLTPTLRATGNSAALATRSDASFSIPVTPKEYYVRQFASLSKRQSDLRLTGLTREVTDLTIRVPAGANITRMPEAKSAATAFGSYAISVSREGAAVHIVTTLERSKSRILVSEYAAFRQYCENVDRALGQVLTYGKSP